MRAFHRLLVLTLLATTAMTTLAAGSANPLEGTWKLNLTKSRYYPGPAPRELTLIVTTMPDGSEMKIAGLTIAGPKIAITSKYKLDGKDYAYVGSADIDTIAVTRIDDETTTAVLKKAGKFAVRSNSELSADHKTLTITTTGVDSKGTPIKNVSVYDRQ